MNSTESPEERSNELMIGLLRTLLAETEKGRVEWKCEPSPTYGRFVSEDPIGSREG
jgi:hypothetical protein